MCFTCALSAQDASQGTAAQQLPAPPAPTGSAATQPPGTPEVEVVPTEKQFVPPAESPGPGILTRGFTLTPLGDQQIRFRPFFTVAGVTDSGLIGFSTSNGEFVNQQAYGVEAGFGITGRRLYKKDTLELEFRGNVSHYSPNSSYDGGNYILSLTYQHKWTRHLAFALTESAGYYSSNYSLLNSTYDLTTANTNLVVTPNTQLFDNSTLYLSTGADVVWQKSARWSFDFGGTGFLVRRRSSSLYGTTGSQARVDTSYRLTRRTTFGAFYEYSHYEFNRAFGGSDLHSVGFIYSYALSRNAELRLRVGGSQVETTGLEQITIDPVIAQILGYNTGQIAIHRVNYVPDFSAQLSRNFQRGTATVEYVSSISPGNGVFLTSRRNSVSGHYDYTGARRWTYSFGAGRDTLSTLGVLIGKYTSNTVRGGVNRVLSRGFQANAYTEYRHYDISGAPFLRNAYRISLGIAWSPTERPLKLW